MPPWMPLESCFEKLFIRLSAHFLLPTGGPGCRLPGQQVGWASPGEEGGDGGSSEHRASLSPAHRPR